MQNIEEEIKKLLEKDKKGRDFLQIVNYMQLDKEYDEEVASVLAKLVDNYDLYCSKKGRYFLFNDSDMADNYIKGKFMDTDNSYGFVNYDSKQEDIFIHGSNTGGAIDGDTVLVYLLKGKKNDKKIEGKIVKVIEHAFQNKVGEVYHLNNKIMVNLDQKNIKKKIMLNGQKDEISRLVDGDKVLVSFIGSKSNRDGYIYADYVRRIGNINDPDIDILSIIADCGFNIDFPDTVIEELKNIPVEVLERDMKNRHDLRNMTIFTIDGDDTKDIDDAISISKLKNGNYRLGVHIADVSYYVKENSPLDVEARNRGTSVYLTDRVIPMIPHQLSNGICSLNPNVDRLAITCDMEINSKGNVVSHDIYESVIRSRIQMTYKKVNSILEKDVVPEGYELYANDLKLMKELSDIIRHNKVLRGCIDFDTDEAKIIVDADGKPIDIIKRERGTGEKLIEDFMIIANETVATHLSYLEVPSVYRVHGDPDEERLLKFVTLLNNMGINIKEDLKKINPRVIQHIIEELKKHEEFKVLSTMMLCCMDKAIYDTKNIGHFGIASKCYTHFTSPIRRYPDTTIHRLLHNYLFMSDGITDEKIRHFEEVLPPICLHASERERASIECEREVESLKMAEYMESHIGEEYDGMISGITNFGMFVQLDNLIEGLIPLLSLNELYIYDQKREMLIGSNTHKMFKVGDKLKVRVVKASKEERTIDFEIAEGNTNEKMYIKKKSS